MTRRNGNVGDIPEVTADEDVDPDVEIAEKEFRRVKPQGRTSRQRIEELNELRREDGE